MPTKIWTVTKFGDPDVPIDYKDLDDPFPLEVILQFTNNHTAGLYMQATFVTPPAAYNNATQNLGLVAAGGNLNVLFNAVTRALPGVRTDETITLRVKAFTDSGYTVAFADAPQGDLALTVRLFDHTALTLNDKDDMDNASAESWVGCTVDTTRYYSAPYSVYINGSSGSKSFTIGAVTRCFAVLHVFQVTSYAIVDVKVGPTIIIPAGVMQLFGYGKWIRLVVYLPPSAANTITIDSPTGQTIWLDEVWVVTE